MQPSSKKSDPSQPHNPHNPPSPQPTPHHQQILNLFNKLHQQISTLDQKVQLLIERHEGEFVHAYHNHVRKIKIDLEALKRRSDEQEKELKDNNRGVFLEKQAMLFRDQSLKLYERLEAKTQEVEYYKYRCRDLEKTNAIMQKQIRQTLKTRKMSEATITLLKEQVQKHKTQLQTKTQQLQSLTETLASTYQQEPQTEPPLHLKLKQSTRLTTNTKLQKTSYGSSFRKRSISNTSFIGRDSQLKQWFLQCVKVIKKEVASRKGANGQIGLEDIRDVRQFMVVDKLRLLEKFMENESLLVWMYEKIFPSRANELKEYLTHRSTQMLDTEPQQQQQQQQRVSQIKANRSSTLQTSTKLDINLPKMSSPVMNKNNIQNGNGQHQGGNVLNSHRANQVSNRLSFKEGRLRIVNL